VTVGERGDYPILPLSEQRSFLSVQIVLPDSWVNREHIEFQVLIEVKVDAQNEALLSRRVDKVPPVIGIKRVPGIIIKGTRRTQG
jgi:hypothetical protein